MTLRPDVYGDRGLDISYNISDNSSWAGLVHTLHSFLAGRLSQRSSGLGSPGKCARVGWTVTLRVPTGYTPASQRGSINCSSEKYFFQETFGAPNHTKFSCKFTADMLQNCSGLVDPSFGFGEGKPCFIIKMNRVSAGGLPWNLPCAPTPLLACANYVWPLSRHECPLAPPWPEHCADCRAGEL